MFKNLFKTKLRATLTVIALVFVALQLVPVGKGHHNPPVVVEPQWDSPRTRELAVRACYDCHSNETHWPWYAHVAPLSWWIEHHVDEGRETVNFSEWQKKYREAHESAEVVEKNEMPLGYYKVLHSTARLSEPERQELIEGLKRTLGEHAPAQ